MQANEVEIEKKSVNAKDSSSKKVLVKTTGSTI